MKSKERDDFLLDHAGQVLVESSLIPLVAESVDVAIRLGRLADSSHRAVKIGGFVKWLVASPAFVARWGKPATLEAVAKLPFAKLARPVAVAFVPSATLFTPIAVALVPFAKLSAPVAVVLSPFATL